jgi:hypothetical protein
MPKTLKVTGALSALAYLAAVVAVFTRPRSLRRR